MVGIRACARTVVVENIYHSLRGTALYQRIYERNQVRVNIRQIRANTLQLHWYKTSSAESMFHIRYTYGTCMQVGTDGHRLHWYSILICFTLVVSNELVSLVTYVGAHRVLFVVKRKSLLEYE